MTTTNSPTTEPRPTTVLDSDVSESGEGETTSPDATQPSTAEPPRWRPRAFTRTRLAHWVVYLLLPLLVFAVAGVGAHFKHTATLSATDSAEAGALTAARDSTVSMLTYQPDTVEQTLTAARNHLTGEFLDRYTQLMNDMVIPGARANNVSTTATVAAAGIIDAQPRRVVTLLYVNQHVTMDSAPPTDTATTVKVTLDKVNSQWLISDFEPV